MLSNPISSIATKSYILLRYDSGLSFCALIEETYEGNTIWKIFHYIYYLLH
ncbi:hypothetical protein NMYAN_30157 [Nitrosomonas nitrosa]|uniref:Uncharacterized protein n=1 Tax=Nitrosomonas nitrosa TaxID=52442 RepID=A0A8H8Z080_9PROT|nr:hypothetical protein NMYAN_30157 [Nitrosomonas nitrosa]